MGQPSSSHLALYLSLPHISVIMTAMFKFAACLLLALAATASAKYAMPFSPFMHGGFGGIMKGYMPYMGGIGHGFGHMYGMYPGMGFGGGYGYGAYGGYGGYGYGGMMGHMFG